MSGYATILCAARAALGLTVCAAAMPGAVAAQEHGRFATAVADCAGFMAARSDAGVAFAGRMVNEARDDTSWTGSLFYAPEGGGGQDFAMTFSYQKGTSLSAAEWSCGGAGDNGPLWPAFDAGEIETIRPALSEAGFVEVNFPGGPKGFANCDTQPADMFMVFAVRDDDRTVFSATSGPAAAAYCMMGVKE